MSTLLSFTEGNAPRYPAPDVARGFMLLLIALANVGAWAAFTGTWQTSSALDSFLTILRLGFVDQRSYPLFAMLFGFGLAIMVQRQRAHSLKYARRRADAMSRRSRPEYLLAVASEKARNLLHRRAWWMLLVGLLHGLIFPGDVIGSYALVALLFAGLIVAEKYRTMIALGVIPLLLGVVGVGIDELIPTGETEQLLLVEYTPLTPLFHLGTWVTITLTSLAFSNILLAAALGAYLATTDIITHPERHRHLLTTSAVVGLSVGVVTGLPAGLVEGGYLSGEGMWWIYGLASLGGVPAAWGWLSLLTLFAGPARQGTDVRGARWVLCAVGRRSMTAYLAQSLFFLLVFSVASAVELPVSESANVLIACLGWALIATGCVALEKAGKRGPFEVLLRRAVAQTRTVEPRPVIADVAFLTAT